MSNFRKTDYLIQSLCCGKTYKDENWVLECPEGGQASLIRAVYDKKQLNPNDNPGLYTFSDWLPVSRMLEGSGAPITYKSEGVAKELGLENLYFTFNGYWPEKGAKMMTGTFKECEAFSVCGRMDPDEKKVLVIASAGNTARAFARVCSANNIPLLLAVPEDNLGALWFNEPINDCVKLIASESGADYFDAIHLSNLTCKLKNFFPEGGAKNVARRDGMGTTVLSAVTTIGEIPDYYFQAVGSGTGAVAAWEMNLRFLEDGRFGDNKMKLMVSQNEPFIPMKLAWDADSADLLPQDDMEARHQVEEINAKVLSNRKPVWGVKGGLYEALKDTDGDVLTATNEEGAAAAELFKRLEGNDIEPSPAIALATLIKEVKAGKIDPKAKIMVNVTGGGIERFKSEHEIHYLKPELVFPIDPDENEVLEKVEALFQ